MGFFVLRIFSFLFLIFVDCLYGLGVSVVFVLKDFSRFGEMFI